MPDDPVEQQWPDVLAMVLADAVLHDVVSGKFFIHGTYSVIIAAEFPFLHQSLIAYFAITNGHGETPIKFRLVDVDESRDPVFEGTQSLKFPDPLAVVEGVFAARNVVFPEPGEYRLQMFGAGHPLRERRVQVIPAHALGGDSSSGEGEPI